MTARSDSSAGAPIYTPDSVERGYNNRAAVPEHPQWLAKFTDESRKAVAALSPRLDLRYPTVPLADLDHGCAGAPIPDDKGGPIVALSEQCRHRHGQQQSSHGKRQC